MCMNPSPKVLYIFSFSIELCSYAVCVYLHVVSMYACNF